MTRARPWLRSFLLALPVGLLACSAEPSDSRESGEDAFTSNDGATLELRFEGQIVTDVRTEARAAVVAQLQYVQGILTTAAQANGQVGMVSLEAVEERQAGDRKTVSYKAALPVVWPKSRPAPASYELVLPRDTTTFAAFNAKYDGTCGRNEYGQETFWHDWNPGAPGCRPVEGDVLRTTATVAPHPKSTQGKYPEYDRVWADDRLDVTIVFGIISSNTPDDEGAREMESTLGAIARTLTNPVRTDTAASGTLIKTSALSGDIDVGGRARKVNVSAMLVSEVASAGSDFDALYKKSTKDADLVVYSGHSGLGANIAAIAKRATVAKDKYQLFYLNGCQTFAYLGRDLHDAKIAANGKAADPAGTKDLDIVANALPAYGDDGRTTMTLYDALVGSDRPKDFNAILRDFSRIHLVAVFGEEDNVFAPR